MSVQAAVSVWRGTAQGRESETWTLSAVSCLAPLGPGWGLLEAAMCCSPAAWQGLGLTPVAESRAMSIGPTQEQSSLDQGGEHLWLARVTFG